MALIEFRGVRKAFGAKVVYRGLDLDVHKGESLTILGGSGQGKSVMLKLLIGLLEVDAGSIKFDGVEVTKLRDRERAEVRRRIGMLFQSAALFDSLTVRENVAYGLREHGRPTEKEVDEVVARSLGYVGLPGIEHMWPADLSGGMRKRVGLARTIALAPEVVLYDEPTTGLDPINTTRINKLINHLKRTLSITSVVVTHDMGTTFSVSDRIVMVHDGQVIFEGTPEQIRRAKDPRVANFISGTPPDDDDEGLHLAAGG
jgi:phospholipid/cholesterol/gamma-HCH transport system ATP-binding protein